MLKVVGEISFKSIFFIFGIFFLLPTLVFSAEYGNPLKHSPYVQLGNAPLTGYDDGEDQFQIMWQTVAGGGSETDWFEVDYSKVGSGATTTIASSSISTITTGIGGRINHYVDITGLDYNSDYDYVVKHIRNGSTLASYSATYRTRLEAGDTTPFSFIAYGDSAASPIANYRAVQDSINGTNGAFSILLGDNVYDSGTHPEWDLRFDQTVNPEAAEWNKNHIDFFGWGNHDIVSASGQPAFDNYAMPIPVEGVTSPVAAPVGETAEKNFSFDYGSVHFLTFDTSNAVASNSRLDNQLDWAVADLEASEQQWKVVFVHYPILSISYTNFGPTSYYYQQVVSRLKDAGADVIMAGHAHTYERSYPLTGQSGSTVLFTDNDDNNYLKGGGLTEIISGLGGRDLLHNGNTSPTWLAFARTGNTSPTSEFGYNKVDVTLNEMTFSQIASSDDEVIDSVTLYGGLSSTDVEPENLYLDAVGSTTISFTTVSNIPVDGKIVVTFPTSLGDGFDFNSGGSTAIATSTGFDGNLSLGIAGNVVTITRSGGTISGAGAKSITLSHVQNPDTAGSTGVYQIKTTTNAGVTIDEESGVSADTITAEPPDWWDSEWNNRIKITLDNSGQAENLTNFPLLVKLDSTRVDYADILSGGDDVRFVDADNLTELPYEIETWNASGTSTLWAKVPQINASSDTDYIYMYYNNPAASASSSPTNVWTNYEGVWHFNEDPSGSAPQIQDSTSANSDGTTAGSMASNQSVTGQIGNALNLTGDDYINFGSLGAITNRTVDMWVNGNSWAITGTYANTAYAFNTAVGGNTDIVRIGTSGNAGYYDGATLKTNESSTGISIGEWHHFSFVSNVTGGTSYIYQDGVLVATVSAWAPSVGGTDVFFVGQEIDTVTPSDFFNGKIDEVRVSNVARSADWIAAEFENQSDTFQTYASAESYSGTETLTSTSVVPASLEVSEVGNVVVSFTTASTTPSDGKIVITFPTTLGDGFDFDSGDDTEVTDDTGFDGNFSVSSASNVLTITRSGGTNAAAGAKSITLSNIKNPNIAGTTGVYMIKTTDSADTTIEEENAVTASTITAGELMSTNVEPVSPVVSTAGNVTVTFNTEHPIPSNGKIVITFPTSLGSGFTFNSGGTTAATSETMGGSLAVGIASNVITITRSGGTDTTAGETESITLSYIQNPTSTGSTGVYGIKTTNSTGGTIDEDASVGADTISSVGAAEDWWDNDWSYRKKITFDNSANAANLVNFPVRVVVATSTDTYDNFKAAGADVRFVDADGVTALDFEIENWDNASTSNMWVEVPQIDASSAVDYIYMYYGNDAATSAATTTGVWDSNYVTVYHFGATSGTYDDSTSYAHRSDIPTGLTSRGGAVSGGIGAFPQFAGGASNSYVSIADSTDYDMDNFTIEAYINKASSGGTTVSTGTGGQTAAYPIVTKGMAEAETTAADVQFFFGMTATPVLAADIENDRTAGGTSQNAPVSGATTLSNSTWYHATTRFDNSADTFRVYLDGSQNGTISTTYNPSKLGTHKVGIGTATKAGGVISAGGGFAGYIDEVRISNIARSTEWIAASASSTVNNFNTYGTEEDQGSGVLTSTNVEPASLSAGAVGNITVSFTTVNDLPSDGKIIVTLPTSLGTGFTVNSGGTTATTSVSGIDGVLSTSASGNTITVTRSGGTTSTAGAKSITLSYIKNPTATGSTGTYQIRTTTSGSVTIDQDLAVTADTITATSLSSTNVEPASLVESVTGNAVISFTTTNSIPATGKIVVTFPTSLGSGFILGTPSVVSATGINGAFTVATSTNVMTITRTGTGNSSSAGAKTITVSGITNPNTTGSTGVYQIKTTNSSNTTIDEDASVSADTIVAADVAGPGISSVDVTESSTSATITWTTDELASSLVNYGLTSTYTATTTEEDTSPRVTSHSVDISGLQSCTTYHFRVSGSDASSNISTSTDSTFSTTGCTGSASIENQNVTAITTASGGDASLTTGGKTIELTVPSGFAAGDVTFQIVRLESGDFSDTAGSPDSTLTLVGDYTYNLKAFTSATTTTTSFLEPITITITYLDEDVEDYDESTLVIYRYSSGTWNALSDCVVDVDVNTVTCETSNFSDFAVFGEPTEEESSDTVDTSNRVTGYRRIAKNQNIDLTSAISFIFTRDLKAGDDNADVKELQKYLNKKGFVVSPFGFGSIGNETTYFGPATKSAVVNLQLANNINPPVGFVGPLTRGFLNANPVSGTMSATPTPAPTSNVVTQTTTFVQNSGTQYLFTKDLEEGSIDEDVRLLQKYLNEKGFTVAILGPGSIGNETNIFGPATKNALIKFQTANGINPAIGYFGPLTRSSVK